MIKYDLILCNSIINDFIKPVYPWESDYSVRTIMKLTISQHNVVLSESLMESYIDTIEPELQDYLQEMINSFSSYSEGPLEWILDSDEQWTDHDDLLILLSGNKVLKYPKIICGNCKDVIKFEKKLKPKKAFHSSDYLNQDINSKIRRASIPFSFHVNDGDQCDVYSSWLGDMFLDETNISIFDPYALNSRGLKSLCCYYLKRIKCGAQLNIYTNVANSDCKQIKTTVNNIAKKYSISIRIYDSNYALHDRHIFTGSCHIVLGRGIDFLDADRKRARDCSINMDDSTNLINNFESMYKLYSESFA